jgi:cell wall-associated NlpC family hydrolase
LPEASLKDVISETRRVTAERGVTVSAKKTTAKKATAKKATAKKATAKKATAKKATTKKATTKKATTKKATAKKATARASSQPEGAPARRVATPSRRGSTLTAPGRSGDLIVIDSPQVGSPPREGEVLEVIHGEVSVSYRVRWADGHESLIGPKSGTARIVRASKRA